MEQTTFETIDKKKRKAESDAKKSQWKAVAMATAKDVGLAFVTGAVTAAGAYAFGRITSRSSKQADVVQLRKVI